MEKKQGRKVPSMDSSFASSSFASSSFASSSMTSSSFSDEDSSSTNMSDSGWLLQNLTSCQKRFQILLQQRMWVESVDRQVLDAIHRFQEQLDRFRALLENSTSAAKASMTTATTATPTRNVRSDQGKPAAIPAAQGLANQQPLPPLQPTAMELSNSEHSQQEQQELKKHFCYMQWDAFDQFRQSPSQEHLQAVLIPFDCTQNIVHLCHTYDSIEDMEDHDWRYIEDKHPILSRDFDGFFFDLCCTCWGALVSSTDQAERDRLRSLLLRYCHVFVVSPIQVLAETRFKCFGIVCTP